MGSWVRSLIKARRSGRSATRLVVLATADAPLVVVVLLFLFVTSEVWQFFGQIERARYATVFTLFLIFTAIFMVKALWLEVQGLATECGRRAVTRFWGELALRLCSVGVVTFCFFLLLGAAGIDLALTASWTGVPADQTHVLASQALVGQNFVVTEALIRVASLMSAFAVLAFAIDAMGNEQLRARLVGEALDGARQRST